MVSISYLVSVLTKVVSVVVPDVVEVVELVWIVAVVVVGHVTARRVLHPLVVAPAAATVATHRVLVELVQHVLRQGHVMLLLVGPTVSPVRHLQEMFSVFNPCAHCPAVLNIKR